MQLLCFLLTLLSASGFGQCATNKVEIRVEIITDAYGNETYWTLTDFTGAVIMQGGQGGVYGNNTRYSDSICVLANGCFFLRYTTPTGTAL
ncbi:MAG: hypothetical protein ACKVOM_12790 [Ferruginibacter sp.]